MGIAEKHCRDCSLSRRNFVATKNAKPNKSDAFAVHVLARRVLNCSNENKAGSETRGLGITYKIMNCNRKCRLGHIMVYSIRRKYSQGELIP